MAKREMQLRIVLVRPRNPLNLLAAARAAANFGFEDIVVVAPHPPVWEEARTKDGASRWLRHAHLAEDLAEAVADRKWVLATSSLARRRMEELPDVLSLDHVASQARRVRSRNRVALVFGSEKSGLSNRDIAACHAVVRIPTRVGSASMNLGQAVAVCCYELRAWGQPHRLTQPLPEEAATREEIVRILDAIDAVFGASGMPAGERRKKRDRLLRMFLRWPLMRRDVSQYLGLIRELVCAVRQAP